MVFGLTTSKEKNSLFLTVCLRAFAVCCFWCAVRHVAVSSSFCLPPCLSKVSKYVSMLLLSQSSFPVLRKLY